jgi:pSer/pThr/pTyr-binding forkhead associated (FHA) protein
MPKLLIPTPDGSEHPHDLTAEVTTIGRLPDNVIQIDDASVSSHHAQIIRVGSEYELKDLGSTNGTRVDGQRINEMRLTHGSTVSFGKIDTTFCTTAAADTKPLPVREALSMTPAQSSRRPDGFVNASPYRKPETGKNRIGALIMGFALLAMVVFLGALASILTLQPPQ